MFLQLPYKLTYLPQLRTILEYLLQRIHLPVTWTTLGNFSLSHHNFPTSSYQEISSMQKYTEISKSQVWTVRMITELFPVLLLYVWYTVTCCHQQTMLRNLVIQCLLFCIACYKFLVFQILEPLQLYHYLDSLRSLHKLHKSEAKFHNDKHFSHSENK